MAFQNPAQNFAEQRLNFGDLVSLSPHSTYLMRSAGDYPDAGILKDSLLAVDRALTPRHNHIIVAQVGDELVLRRLILHPRPALQELGEERNQVVLEEFAELPVWGVVAYAVTDLAGIGFNGH